jgi:hypothetical protein
MFDKKKQRQDACALSKLERNLIGISVISHEVLLECDASRIAFIPCGSERVAATVHLVRNVSANKLISATPMDSGAGGGTERRRYFMEPDLRTPVHRALTFTKRISRR